jgi:hypothetical protein
MIPARKAINAHAQDFVANKRSHSSLAHYTLPEILYVFVSSSRTVCRSHQQQPSGPRCNQHSPHLARHAPARVSTPGLPPIVVDYTGSFEWYNDWWIMNCKGWGGTQWVKPRKTQDSRFRPRFKPGTSWIQVRRITTSANPLGALVLLSTFSVEVKEWTTGVEGTVLGLIMATFCY